MVHGFDTVKCIGFSAHMKVRCVLREDVMQGTKTRALGNIFRWGVRVSGEEEERGGRGGGARRAVLSVPLT